MIAHLQCDCGNVFRIEGVEEVWEVECPACHRRYVAHFYFTSLKSDHVHDYECDQINYYYDFEGSHPDKCDCGLTREHEHKFKSGKGKDECDCGLRTDGSNAFKEAKEELTERIRNTDWDSINLFEKKEVVKEEVYHEVYRKPSR